MSRGRRRGVSWDYHVALDAWPSIRALDAELQEAVLDAVKSLCDEAEDRGWSGEVQERLYPNVSGSVWTVNLFFIANPARRLLSLTDVEA